MPYLGPGSASAMIHRRYEYNTNWNSPRPKKGEGLLGSIMKKLSRTKHLDNRNTVIASQLVALPPGNSINPRGWVERSHLTPSNAIGPQRFSPLAISATAYNSTRTPQGVDIEPMDKRDSFFNSKSPVAQIDDFALFESQGLHNLGDSGLLQKNKPLTSLDIVLPKPIGSHSLRLLEPRDLSGFISRDVLFDPLPGTYSDVYRGLWGTITVAIKVIRVTSDSTTTMRRKVKRERHVWASLDHENIVPLYGFAEGRGFGHFGALISPWLENGDVTTFLKKWGEQLSLDERVNLWEGVVKGVKYLHDCGLVHGDLKPANVLIDENRVPRICDFGLIRIFLEDGNSGWTTTSGVSGTDRYMAPELLQDSEDLATTTFSDIWALGCVGLDVVFLQRPYSKFKNNIGGKIFDAIKYRKELPAEKPVITENYAASLWTQISSCWEYNPSKRPSARDILQGLTIPDLDSIAILQSPKIQFIKSSIVERTPIDW